MSRAWTRADMPGLHDRIAVVTGANRGLGLEIAKGLVAAGAELVIACRDPLRAEAAVATLRGERSDARVTAMALDLADLASIRDFATAFGTRFPRLDILVHNAAAILVPLGRTRDGFERHLGTNHLGPFALTALLLDALRAAPAARVVSTGSLAHRMTTGLDLDDPHFAHTPYKEMEAYGRSKLAALSFCFELDRRLRRAGLPMRSVAAHPGYTATNPGLGGFFMRLSTRLFAQKPAMGALPALRAASATDVSGGEYYGPGGLKELGGSPERVDARAEAYDEALAARLWALSEQLTGIRYPV